MLLDPVIAMAIQASMALLLAAAAWHKLRDWPRIGGVIAGYRMLPQAASSLAAAVLIAIELSLAAGTLISRKMLLGAAALLLAYAFAIGLNILRGNDRIDCGCTAKLTAAPRLRWAMCARNAGIALVAITVGSLSVSVRPIVWIDLITIVCVLVGLWILYATYEATMGLPPSGVHA